MAETTGKADGSTDSYLAMLSASAGCDCTFGATINANVLPNNTYGIATRGYVDASIKKHDEDKDAHDFMLSGFVSEINGLKPVNHSLSLSSIRCADVYGEVISELRSDGTGTVNGSSIRYATTDSISSIVEKVVKPFEAASASWNGAASTVSSCSAIWNAASTETTTSSANWSSVYATVSAASAGWDGGGEAKVKADSVYATVSSCSAEWEGRQEQIYVDNDDEDEISPWVDTTPKTDTVNRLVTSRGVAEALFGKMGNSFPVSVYQNGKKYKVSIGDDGAGNIGFVVTSGDSYPIRWRYQNLTNTNTAAYAYDKEPYRGKLVADDNCVLSGMWCTMGGEQQTVSADGTIAIPSVTGDVFIGGYALSNNKGNWNENGNVLTLATDSYLDTATSSVLHLGKFAISMDGSEIILNCGTLKMPFFVTYDLENATSTSSVTSLQPETPYSTLLSADYGYSMATSSCTMGGVPQPIVDGSVSIASVTGDISVKAHANLASEAYFSSDTTCTLKLPSDTRYSPSDKTLFFGKSTSGEAPSGFTMRGSRSLLTFTVTNSLTNCTSNNSSNYVTETRPYSATITPNFGHKMDYVTCTMGGEAVEVTDGVINIERATGNIFISASATFSNTVDFVKNSGTYTLACDTAYEKNETAKTCGITYGSGVLWNPSTGTVGSSGASREFFAVANSLTGCTSSNASLTAESGFPYEATITPNERHSLKYLSCTMGGVPQTVVGGEINIPSVTGEISIIGIAKPFKNYLAFSALEDNSSVAFSYVNGTDVKYSINGGEWTDYQKNTTVILPKRGDTVKFRGRNVTTNYSNRFSMSGRLSAGGSVTSMTDESGGYETVQLAVGCYSYMFQNCSSLVIPPELPAVGLSEYCYAYMFQNCTALIASPELPSTELADGCYIGMFYGCTSLSSAAKLAATATKAWCYQYMFSNCTSLVSPPLLAASDTSVNCYEEMFAGCASLTSAPQLPSETVDSECYVKMFYGCSSLVEAPELPATTLSDSCYYGMFYGCSSLVEAPELPATTLSTNCYDEMFIDCTSLVRAPSLPATEALAWCYCEMFRGCTSLAEAPELPATTLSDSCYYGMFENCTSLTRTPILCAETVEYISYESMFKGCSALSDVITKQSSFDECDDWLSGVSIYGAFHCTQTLKDVIDALPSRSGSNVPPNWTIVVDQD